MVYGHQLEVQMLARFLPFGGFFALEKVLHERRLIRGKTLTTTAKIEESVAVFEEDWREVCSCLSHGSPGGVLGVGGSRSMIE
jgi:hypothetical protein